MSPDLIAIALSTAFIGILIYRFANIVIRLEQKMPNNSAALTEYITATTTLIKAQADEIAALKVQATPDLDADEAAITSGIAALQAAGVTLPPAPVEPVAVTTEAAPQPAQ